MDSAPLDTRSIRNSCATMCAVLVAVPILYHGAGTHSHATAMVGLIEGFVSAATWFASAIVPLYYEPARQWHAVSLILNSIAAAATAGVVLVGIP